MIMIRNILILTVLAALVPTAMSNVSASAGSEIALFSGVSDSDGLSISGNGDSAKMELKATNENGKTKKVSDFQMNADNVLYIKVGDKVTVNDNVDFTKAITTDGNNNQKAIGITSNGVIDFTGYTQGVSTLDVVVDDDRAYEAIIVIGHQPPEVINKQVTKVNNNQEFRVQLGLYPDPDPKPCEPGEYCPPCPEGVEADWCQDRDEYLDFDCSLEGMEDDPRCIDGEPDPCYVNPDDPNCGEEPEPEPRFDSCGCPILPGTACPQMACEEPIERTDDPNHGEIKGDEELQLEPINEGCIDGQPCPAGNNIMAEEDEEEHQEEEESEEETDEDEQGEESEELESESSEEEESGSEGESSE
jgi:hypothetical protein